MVKTGSTKTNYSTDSVMAMKECTTKKTILFRHMTIDYDYNYY